MRLIDADALKVDLTRFYNNMVTAKQLIDEQPTVGGWISVKDMLPEVNQRVLVFGVGKYEDFIGTTQIAITHMSDENLINRCYKSEPYWIAPWQYFLTDYEITHWMPLPEPPKEVDTDGDSKK